MFQKNIQLVEAEKVANRFCWRNVHSFLGLLPVCGFGWAGLVAAWALLQPQCPGSAHWRPLSRGARALGHLGFSSGSSLAPSTGSVAVAQKLSCSMARGISPDQGSNPHLLHWQVNSLPLSHQGSPNVFLNNTVTWFKTQDTKGYFSLLFSSHPMLLPISNQFLVQECTTDKYFQ